jgi:hypothetical protein
MVAYQYSQQIRDSGFISKDVILESGKYFGYYYETIQKGLAEGRIKAFPVDLLGGFLCQSIVAVMNHLRVHQDQSTWATVIQQGFELFWDGIRTKGTE